MSVDIDKIYDKIVSVDKQLTAISTRQEERHAENKQDVSVLFTKLERLDNKVDVLPCDVHKAKLNISYGLIMLMVSGAIGGFFWLLRK